jgi:hypothetical protein
MYRSSLTPMVGEQSTVAMTNAGHAMLLPAG